MIIEALRQRIVNVDKAVTESEQINGLQVIHTPGHTYGSIALYKKKFSFNYWCWPAAHLAP